MHTITLEYIDGKTVRLKNCISYTFDLIPHCVSIETKATRHIIPMLNIRDMTIEKE